jgi:hypothetical protein
MSRTNRMVRSQKGVPSNKEMKLPKPEHIGASQLVSGVPLTVVPSIGRSKTPWRDWGNGLDWQFLD